MLTAEAALVGAGSLLCVTLATVHLVARYDDDFVNTESYAWSGYAGLYTLACVLTMAMGVAESDAVAYGGAAASNGALAALCVWMCEKHRETARKLRDEASARLLDTIDE